MPVLIGYPGHEILLDDIVRAEGVSLFDSRGRRYVDLESGVWCTTIGHGHPRVTRVLQEQAARITHAGYCYSTDIVPRAAEELLDHLGMSEGRGVFLASGSEAVEFGVRSLQAGSGKPLLMTMADSYFGAYGSAQRRAESEWYVYDWLGCMSCPVREDGSHDCEHWRRIPFERIGGFLFEPGSSSGFVRFPPEDLIHAIVRRVREEGGFVMVNEVTTGFGRTGRWFGHQHYGVRPDVVALGKSMGNGYPVSFTAFAPTATDPLCREPLLYAQSHQNDPLGAAVAREVVRVIDEERLIERSKESARVLGEGLAGIQRRTSRITEIRGRGLLVAVDLSEDPSGASRVQRELVRRGFVVAVRGGSSTFRIDPPLNVGHEDLKRFLDTFESVLRAS